MSGEAFDLSMAISGYLFDQFISRDPSRFPGDADEYQLEDSEEGEPFILTRKRDGKQFAVDLVAEVEEVAA
jgi:hypothetical protein